MSRIGRKPINIPAGVEVKVDGSCVTVKGPKGTLTQKFQPSMNIAVEGAEIVVTRPNDDKENRCSARPHPYPYPQHDRGCNGRL